MIDNLQSETIKNSKIYHKALFSKNIKSYIKTSNCFEMIFLDWLEGKFFSKSLVN